MNRQRFRFYTVTIAILTAVMMMSCAKSNDDAPFGLAGDAEVRLSVGLDSDVNEQSIGDDSKVSKGVPSLDPHKDLAVYIIDTKNDTLARWACFSDVPESLKFTAGAYKIVAEYKPKGTKIPDFNIYVYRAEEKFVIKAGDQLHFDLVAKLATANVSVEFDHSFASHYVAYSADLRTGGLDSLRFKTNEKRVGSFEPGSVRMQFNLVSVDGKFLSFSPPPLMKANAADYYKLNLKVDSDQGGVQIIRITTVDGLNDAKDFEIKVPKYFLPKNKPEFTGILGFASGVPQKLIEGAVSKWNVAANVPGGLSSFVIRFNEGSTSLSGGQAVVDLASLPEKDPLRDVLKAAGFVWGEGLNSPEDAAMCAAPYVNFTKVMKSNEDGTPGNYNFQFELTDNYNQTPATNHPCIVQAEIKVPIVTFDEIVTENIWATKADLTIKANYDIIGGVRPALQYRKDGGGEWHDALAENVTVTQKALEGATFVAGYELTGLTAKTEYQFRTEANGRYIYPDREGVGSGKGWTTEEALGVPGLVDGGFKDIWNTESATTALGVKVENPSAGSVWATRNALSTAQKILSINSSTGIGTMAVSVVSANNGTSLITNPINVMRKAVELRTTAWGRGTYSNMTTEKVGSWLNAGSPAQGIHWWNVSAGIIYIGTYIPGQVDQVKRIWNWHNGKIGGGGKEAIYWHEQYVDAEGKRESITETGVDFVSRPNSLKFQHIFTSAGGSFLVRAELQAANGTVIATASWSSADPVPGMQDKTLIFDYSNKPLLKAAKIKIFFSSDSNLTVGVPNGGPSYKTTTDGTPHLGNVLVIDNVELGYDF